MSRKQLQRMKVVENAVSGRLKVSEAAEMLQLSERQMTRLKGRVTGEGVDWVYHGNRGRSPSNAISDEIREAVVKLAVGKYVGFNDSHLQEKLTAEETIVLSRQSVRRILRAAQIGSPQKRRATKYRSRRDRRAGRHEGADRCQPARLAGGPRADADHPGLELTVPAAK